MQGDVILIWFILQTGVTALATEHKIRKSASATRETLKQGMLTINGKIKFKGGPPDTIPDASTLTVKFQDTSRMDAAAVNLGTYVGKINGYKKEDVLKYEIKTDKRPELPEATVSAVLNIGWGPEASGDEWIRRGDWLTDTQHTVDISKAVNGELQRDVEIIHYT